MAGKHLGRFDHGPVIGGNGQGAYVSEQYAFTLDMYRYLFGEPPEDIWEPLETRYYADHFWMFNMDLRRLCNYRVTVEMNRNRMRITN